MKAPKNKHRRRMRDEREERDITVLIVGTVFGDEYRTHSAHTKIVHDILSVIITQDKMGCFNDSDWKVCGWGGWCLADTNYLYPARWGWINQEKFLEETSTSMILSCYSYT